MNMQRIKAVFLRHMHLAFRDISRLCWMFYWPFFDIMVWGFTGLWMQQQNAATHLNSHALLTCMVVWQLVVRASFEISLSLLDELWSQNMINMFASPLQLREWICATIIIGLCTNTILLLYSSLLVWLFYGVNLFSLGFMLGIFLMPLLITGISVGFIASAVTIHYGARAQSLIFIMSWALAPFCGVFYPVSILPSWAQAIAYSCPMTYFFEGLREYIQTHTFNVSYYYSGLAMTFVYTGVSLLIFVYMFQKSKEKGLARLIAE